MFEKTPRTCRQIRPFSKTRSPLAAYTYCQITGQGEQDECRLEKKVARGVVGTEARGFEFGK
jgi:hypothetical protein